MGYFLYSIYNISGSIYPGVGTGLVDWQDVLFSCHGLCLSSLHFMQCLIYSRGKNNDFKLWCWLLLGFEALVFLVIFSLECFNVGLPHGLRTVNFCGYGKALITLIKYAP